MRSIADYTSHAALEPCASCSLLPVIEQVVPERSQGPFADNLHGFRWLGIAEGLRVPRGRWQGVLAGRRLRLEWRLRGDLQLLCAPRMEACGLRQTSGPSVLVVQVRNLAT